MDKNLKRQNLVQALKLGLINWHQFFEMWRKLSILLIAFFISACSKSGNSVEIPECDVVISKPGVVTLTENIETDGCAVRIDSSNVVFNLNGFTIKGPGLNGKKSYGVFSINQNNVEVFGGTIEDVAYGVVLNSSHFGGDALSGHRVRNISFKRIGFIAVGTQSHGALVHDNEIKDVGGNSFHYLKYVYGIHIEGRSCLITRNKVSEIYADFASAEGVAVSLTVNNSGCVVKSNELSNSIPVTTKNTFGVWVDVYSFATLRANAISGFHYSGVVPPQTIQENNSLDVPTIDVILDR